MATFQLGRCGHKKMMHGLNSYSRRSLRYRSKEEVVVDVNKASAVYSADQSSEAFAQAALHLAS
jgi:hypothetical protein